MQGASISEEMRNWLRCFASICEKADERAAEREERLRLRELEMEERRIERERIGMRRE